MLAASNAAALPWMDESFPLVACCCHTRKGMCRPTSKTACIALRCWTSLCTTSSCKDLQV